MKPILCLDFDGVCHSHKSGWRGIDVIPDPPVPGLFEFLAEAKWQFDIQIYSSRSSEKAGREAMFHWFKKHMNAWRQEKKRGELSIFDIYFPDTKPSAFISIDDRAITFTGEWPDVDDLKAFKPWNKK